MSTSDEYESENNETFEPFQLNHSDQLNSSLNGIRLKIDTLNVNPETTLNDYLRNKLHHTGTKYMCLEGGCGACIVSATIKNPRTGVKETLAVNSCLVSLLSCDGWEITTVEGLGNREDGYHEIQQKIVQFNATQCGFCTPGMVMNMHALMESGKTTMAEIENSFGGNICRCTGYRPILSAYKSLASDTDEKVLGTVPDLDIEDLPLCSKQLNCHKTCQKVHCPNLNLNLNLLPLMFNLENDNFSNKNWYKVSEVKNIFAIFKDRSNSNRSYKLVAGNTAKGVYSDMSEAEYYIDISAVKELRSYSLNTKKLVLGGNLTLTETMDVLRQVYENDDGFKHLSVVISHIDLVATVPVRNIGTLAGNLSMKYLHNEFPSDIFLLFEVIGAQLVIYNGRKQQVVTPEKYLSIDMKHKIIRSIEIPPLDTSYKLETYKVMPKSQNAHAIVNAGFLFKLNNKNVIEKCSIVFGGINPNFVHAKSSEKYAKGKLLFDNGNMQNLFKTLNAELQPDHVLPDAKPEFRKNLAIALLYKFILSIAPEKSIGDMNKSGGQKLIRAPVSNGIQDFKTNKSLYPVGEAIHKLEAADQASGAAKYVTDMPDLPNQAHAAFVMSKARPGSILKAIDAQEATDLLGVEAFFQASDIPGTNSFMAPTNDLFYHVDEPIFVAINDPIKYYFQPIGMVVAKSRKIAQAAADLVKIEYEESATSPLLTVEDVIQSNASERIHHEETTVSRHQDLDAPIKFKGKINLNWQYHNHMELQVVNVIPDDDGGVTLYPTTQWMDGIQHAIQRSLNIPASKISMSVKRVGGGFGSRITRNHWVSCAATLAAVKLRKPVKFFLDLSTNMNVIGKRCAFFSEYDIGVDADGRVEYLNNGLYNNVGAYGNSIFTGFVMELYTNTYKSDAFETDTYWVETDNPASVAMRGPGSFEGSAIIETIMEHISYQVNKDPIDVRLANLNVDKNPLLKKLIDDCLTWSDYRARRAEIETFNENNRWRKKGIAIVPMTFSLMFIGSHFVQVTIYQADGTVAIAHGGVELGQGVNTKAAQAAAYWLGIDMDMIKIKPSNNFTAPGNMATGGSITTECVCLALKEACNKLKTRIDEGATKSNLPSDAPWATKIKNAFTTGVSLTENHMFFDDPDKPAGYLVYGVGVSEVEIDILTGQYIIQRVDIVEDVGDSSNPAIDIGQCEGAFVMGAGNWTSEEIILDEDGELKTNNTWTYKPPGARDIPVDFRVKFPKGIPNPISPYKNKATSEPPTCLAFSVPLAIRHALKSARIQADSKADPWTPINGPSTVEWTFTNSLHDYKQYKL